MKRLIVCLLMSLVLITHGQSPNKLPDFTPQSPNAASLGKYGEVPVSLQSGMTNLTIPLMQIKVGSFELPISVTYRNNGLKVDEIPSWVGLGFDLRLGGAINLNQHGLDDNSSHGILYSPSKDSLQAYKSNAMNDARKADYAQRLMNGSLDGEYDMYSYNFLNYSGQFYFKSDSEIVTVPKSNLKITRDVSGVFHIWDEIGNRYDFGTVEINTATSDPDHLILKDDFSGGGSMLLDGIVTADNRHISFSYQQFSLEYQRTSWTYTDIYNDFVLCPYSGLDYGTTSYTITNQLLSSVGFDGGSIDFVYTDSGRRDIGLVASYSDVPALKKIRLYDSNDSLKNEYTFYTSYFNTDKRLKLDSLVQTNAPNGARWKFEYYGDDQSFPRYFTNGKDHWGYYNGVSTSSTALPHADYSTIFYSWPLIQDDAILSSKRSNFTTARQGMLKSIKYPTGGKSTFNYEPNQFKITSYESLPAQPFLEYDPDEYATSVTKVDDNAESAPIVTGSFTLTSTAKVHISSYMQYEPESFIQASIALGTTPGGTNVTTFDDTYTGYAWTSNKTLELSAGTYYYTIKRNVLADELDEDPPGTAWLLITELQYPTVFPYIVGGCRISTIENDDGLGHLTTKRFQYADQLDSVAFRNIPNYKKAVSPYTSGVIPNPPDNIFIPCMECGLQFTIYEESTYPFTGNPVDYKYVTEFTDSAGRNGKIAHEFLTPIDLAYSSGPTSAASPFWATWRGGLEKQTDIYKKTSTGFSLLQRTVNTYPTDTAEQVLVGLKTSFNLYYITGGNPRAAIPASSCPATLYNENPVNIQTEFWNVLSSTTTNYEETGNIASTQNFTYGSAQHVSPTEVSTTASGSDVYYEDKKYSSDYNGSGGGLDQNAKGIKTLVNKNIIRPVEAITIHDISGTKYVTGGVLNTYDSTTGLLRKTYRLELTAPLLLSSFSTSNISSGTFTMDSHYKLNAEITRYDSYNNILELYDVDRVPQAVIWGYDSLYPVAIIRGWTYADALDGSGIDLSVLSSMTSTESAKLTELNRLRSLSNCQVITYTYKPLSGVSTVTDVSGKTIYYEYDRLNRLVLMRDANNKVLKRICYNYAGQAESCQ